MAKQLVVHKGRANTKTLNLNMSVTGETIQAQIRERPEQDSPLIATWVVTAVDASIGRFNLFLDDTMDAIEHTRGFMDVIRVSGGQPITVFDEPLAVEFRGTVTSL